MFFFFSLHAVDICLNYIKLMKANADFYELSFFFFLQKYDAKPKRMYGDRNMNLGLAILAYR